MDFYKLLTNTACSTKGNTAFKTEHKLQKSCKHYSVNF